MNFKFTTLRPRTKSLSNTEQDNKSAASNKVNKTKTPLGSPVNRRDNKKRNSELDSCPSISSLRSESVALLGDQHQLSSFDDRIYNAEQVSPTMGNCDPFLMEDAEDNSYTTESCPYISTKVALINVERIDGSLGITLRGGYIPEQPHLSRPLTITQVRPNGAAYRTGLIRVGDRVLQVDGHQLTQRTLADAQRILQYNCNSTVSRLSIEYDVSGVLEAAVQYASSGPLLVEIERQGNEELGLLLMSQQQENGDDGVIVEGVVAASTADRCGALHAGDLLMAVDEVPVQHLGVIDEISSCLRTASKLQILPREAVAHIHLQRHLQRYGSIYSTVNSRRSRAAQRNRHSAKYLDSVEAGVSQCTVTGQHQGNTSTTVCHPETLTVTLAAERGSGYGLAVTVQQSDIVISRMSVEGAAFRCGSLQVGDRVLAVNRQPNLTLQEIQAILDMGCLESSPDALSVTVEFDVGDTVVPSTGIFTVRLPKPRSSLGQGLGITITTGDDTNAPFLITEIRRGSAAHRAGCLHAGDHLLAIDGRPLDRLTVDGVLRLLQCDDNSTTHHNGGVVSLRVEKTELDRSNLRLDRVVYSVELQRRSGDDLGITIGHCVDDSSVVLTRVQAGGLAHQTGALHVNDRLLAINGQSLDHKGLGDVMRLLQVAGDRVHLKISRNIQEMTMTTENGDSNGADGNHGQFDSLGLLSNSDSAVHSWNSNSNQDHINDKIDCPDDSRQSTLSTLSSSTCPSPLPLPLPSNYLPLSSSSDQCSDDCLQDPSTQPMRIAVSLHKDTIYDDYGFSVSDGLYARGVFVNRIRQGGPADLVGLLAPYDRIVQVNDTCTVDFDCCLTVPLIASAGDRIDLMVERDPLSLCAANLNMIERDALHLNMMSPRMPFTSSQSTITKTL